MWQNVFNSLVILWFVLDMIQDHNEREDKK